MKELFIAVTENLSKLIVIIIRNVWDLHKSLKK